MRVGLRVIGVVAVLGAACKPQIPSLSYSSEKDGQAVLFLYSDSSQSDVTVCGVATESPGHVAVPFECFVPEALALEPRADIESKPVSLTVKPMFGDAISVQRTVRLDVQAQRRIVDTVLRKVFSGGKLPAKDGKSGAALVFPYWVQGIGAETVGDLGLVVRVDLVNARDTGRTCHYEGDVAVKLMAEDADLEAFDARAARSIAKTRLTGASESCPESTMAYDHEKKSLNTWPDESRMQRWVASLKR